MIGEFDSQELGTLTFGFELSGDYKKVNEVRLALSQGPNCFVVEGKVNGNEVVFDLSHLQEYIPSGEYTARMEVILDDNRYMSPLTESLRVKKAPKVEAKAREVQAPAKLEVKVTATPAKVKSAREMWVERHEREGHTVVQTGSELVAYEGKSKVDSLRV